MRILIEAHHPAHIHFWKFPILKLRKLGHHVRLVARDRDVMVGLLKACPWIDFVIPSKASQTNHWPVREFMQRQYAVLRECIRFRPEVTASLMGSYMQLAGLYSRRNLIFTDSEFQHFNHRIANPFAHEIHTPYCFYKDLGRRQRYYRGIHELAFLGSPHFEPDSSIVEGYRLSQERYTVLRISSWNTLHDEGHAGVGALLPQVIASIRDYGPIVVSGEEGKAPPPGLLGSYVVVHPEDFHHALAFARLVITEGASTAAEAGCLGTPVVYINSTEPRGYLEMLKERYGHVWTYRQAEVGVRDIPAALEALPSCGKRALRQRINDDHIDVCEYVVKTLLD